MAAAFSRLQLAAALLEYDNDVTNPDAPYRSAHDSAIFAHLRRNFGLRPQRSARNSDYLGVSLPSDAGSLGGRESALDNRRSRGSIDALRNPFGADDTLDDEVEGEGEELEVDLSSWGLDAFVPKDQGSKTAKGKAKSAALLNAHPVSSVRSHQPHTNDSIGQPRRRAGARSMSLGTLDYVGMEAQSSTNTTDNRRRSIGSPMDFPGGQAPQTHFQRRASSHALIETSPGSPLLHSVPFPNDSARSASPLFNDHFRPPGPRERSASNPSIDSRILLKDSHADFTHSIFEETKASPPLLVDDNPFSLRPPSRASRFDPKAAAHARTTSNASIGSRLLLDNDNASVMTGQGQYNRERPYSTLELLRPKVLVMPSPLQPVAAPVPAPPVKVRDGFQLSTDGPPLPPGARSSRRYSATLSVIEQSSSIPAPIPSNAFTPNPRMDLSLSQLTFRNTLMVGGQRDVAYADIDGALPRAMEDGEQIHPDPPQDEEELPIKVPQIAEDSVKPGRPAGKLFGRSLIDDLENRKAQMRSKQRVFTGDQRPSMMARGQPQHSNTLIDPSTLQTRPVSQRMSSYISQGSQQPLGRRNSANVKPLLNFDDDDKVPQPNLSPNARMPNSRSVFGVDTLWEREMTKLREIEAQEKVEAEERRKRDAEEEARELKKRGRKGKRKGKSKNVDPQEEATETTVKPRISAEPPVLPVIQPEIRRPPQVQDDDSESDESIIAGPSQPHNRDSTDPGAERWFAGSSDDGEDGPRRTTGTGPRYPKRSRYRQAEPSNESEEDVPLAATLGRVVQRATRFRSEAESDDEEKPLSALLQKTKASLPSINFDNLSNSNGRANDDDDDDDEPLGLRASRAVASPSQAYGSIHEGGDDDDRPLAFHPEQQRRTQYQVVAQQQQRLLMQAQLHSSMFFSPPSMMGPGFFGPPMAAPMMMQQPPMPVPSPPPMHDAAKYGRVDRWRRDVAVEGGP